MDGKIVIHGVSIGDGSDKSIDIGSIEFILDSAFDYIDFNKKYNTHLIPDKLQIKINHAYADSALIDSFAEKPGKIERINSYISALGCGEITNIDNEQLLELGYSGLDASINLVYDYNTFTSTIDAVFELELHGMESYSFKTAIPNIKSYIDLTNPESTIKNLEVKVQDLGFNKKLTEYCANKTGLGETLHVDQHVEKLKNYFTKADIKLSDELYTAYHQYMHDQAEITFNFQPDSAVNLKYIDFFETKDWPKVLGLSLYVDERKVENVEIDWDRQKVVSNLIKAQQDTSKADSKTTLQTKLQYVEIIPSKLNQYVRSQVKLKSKQGKSYEGVITGFSGGQLIMEVTLHGGKIKLPIRTNEIVSAFVSK